MVPQGGSIMSEFELGERVKIPARGNTIGIIRRITNTDDGRACEIAWVLFGKEHSEWFFTKNLGKIAGDRENSTESYKFSVSSVHSIDAELIDEDLSYASPVALVDTGHGKFVVIHESIFTKTYLCKGGIKMAKDMREIFPEFQCAKTLLPICDSDIGKLLALVRKIKKAEYRKKYKSQGEVEVKLLKI